jgi:hypothetical protein
MAILDNLIGYWKLDEASGNALDAHGSHPLTENGTIASAAGKVGNARSFELLNVEHFSHASDSDLQTGDIDFSVAGWVNADGTDFYRTVASKDNIGVAREWNLLIDQDNAGKFTFNVLSGTTSRGSVASSVTPSASTWYYVAAGHVAGSDEIWISVNAGTPVTAATTGTLSTSDEPFLLGAIRNGGNPAIGWGGLIDEFGFWKRDIRSDLAALYNGGSGLPYESFTGGAAAASAPPRRRVTRFFRRSY